jgi:cytochrome c-type biogenesis protein CcmH
MKDFYKIIGSLIFLILFFVAQKSFAFAPEKYLPEPQEQRAREIFLQVKCPVCQGQVIESSDAEIAVQLRKMIRQEIAAGKSDKEIKIYLVAEYGEDILNSPPFDIKNFMLWILPAIFIIVGVFIIKKFTKLSA